MSTTTITQGADLRIVDPATLIVVKNVREANVTRDFVSSIKQHGVLTPIVAVAQEDGSLVVRMGHRRTLAAIEAGRDVVPVYVVQADAADEAGRIVEQITENEHRADLTAAEKASAIEQLSLLGLSAAQIARRTSTKKAEVEAATAVATSQTAKQALTAQPAMTIEDAALLAEFTDDQDATATLLAEFEEGGSGALAHAASRARGERERHAALSAAAEAMAQTGVRVLTSAEADDDKAMPIYRLRTDAGKPLTDAKHAECPGHALALRTSWQRNDDGTWPVRSEAYCTDWKANGHRDSYSLATSSGKKRAEDMTDKEREAAKAERRDVIESNKAWKDAEPVRREWVTAHLSRKTLPKGAGVFIATVVTEGEQWLTHHTTPGLVLTLVYGGKAPARGTRATLSGETDARALVLTLGSCIAAAEASTQHTTWRNPNPLFTAYLDYLTAQGYTPSAVETRGANLAKPKNKAKATTTPTDAA